ncbi:MAG: hypothetical protein HXS52_12740 [Theionarchaea archaeon]|nr:hypothetical protein [Theionarchaea archaeon]
MEWLRQAQYPVTIDPTMETFEDAWETSGFQPYGQYFQDIGGTVGILNGHLNVTQTDLAVPGRGLDLVITRTYETPAVFHMAEPYGYTPCPIDIGKGWRLDFPYVGDDYIYLMGGGAYKIDWVNSAFENHIGSHFILVKNPDNTYALTVADGTICRFSTDGKPTQIIDKDQNAITFNYDGGTLVSLTDTIGRTVAFSYSDGRLKKILYNGAEIEYGYNSNGNLIWVDDFLDRRTSYYYDSDWWEWADGVTFYQKENVYLLSKVVYSTGGYTVYDYGRFSYEEVYGDDGTCLDYFKYYVEDERAYETNQVRHTVFSYSGSFHAIIGCVMAIKDEADVVQGYYDYSIDMNTGLVTQGVTSDASGVAFRKLKYSYNSRKEVIKVEVYNDGTNLSYTEYYAYDNWGNLVYARQPEGHEQFFSYANTSTSGFFIDDTGTVMCNFTNAVSNCPVPSSVHTALLGQAEKQDEVHVKEVYLTYDSEAHPVQQESLFGNYTTWITFSGTFNEETNSTSFPIGLTDHTVVGNAVLEITGLPSDDIYSESLSVTCPLPPCQWCSGYWSGKYYSARWINCYPVFPPDCDEGNVSIGPFAHHPGTLGYQSYTTDPIMSSNQCSQKTSSLTVTTNWRAYPVQVLSNLDGAAWKQVTTNLMNGTSRITVPIEDGSHTLNFSESSSQKTKFSWTLHVPVDNFPETHAMTLGFDTYGNIVSATGPDETTVSMSYSPEYGHAYRTEVSAMAGDQFIVHRATYDYYMGWMTSHTNPDGTDYQYAFDILGRIIKREYPLLEGQSERSYEEAIYDDAERTTTIIDPLRHYVVTYYDRLGRRVLVNAFEGSYGSGTTHASTTFAYRYDGRLVSMTDSDSNTFYYSYDFLGRCTQKIAPDSTQVSYYYDDTNNEVTFVDANGFGRRAWYDWLGRLKKLEEEYSADAFAVTTIQYNKIGQITSLTDAENHVISCFYESLFGPTRQTFSDGTSQEYVYDSSGSLISTKDRGGNQVQFNYDAIGRLAQLQYHDGSIVSFFYDLNSNVVKVVDNCPNPGDHTEYKYDAWNRVVEETRHISSQEYTIMAEYSVISQLEKLTYPDGMQILYSYDDLGELTEIRRYVDGINDEVLIHNALYNSKGFLTQFQYGNGLLASFSYDVRDRLKTVDLWNETTPYLELDYTYDGNSNVVQVEDRYRSTSGSYLPIDIRCYSYDGLNRLVSETRSGIASHTYSYDRVGNMMSRDGIVYTVNSMSEVTSLSDGTAFTFNATGSVTGKTKGSDSWTYVYDEANRLTRLEKNGETLGEYVYDAIGRRIQVTEDGETSTHVYFGRGLLFEESMSGKRAYIYGPGGKLAERKTENGVSSTFYYHLDHLGSTRLVTDESANIVTTVTYHPFGEIDVQEGSEDYLFSGKRKDASDLYYFGARYYDAELGRFLTVDPVPGSVASSQSMNRYSYCANNPVSYIDPWGERTDIPADVREAYYEYRKQKEAEETPITRKIGMSVDRLRNKCAFYTVPGVTVYPGFEPGDRITVDGTEYILDSPIFVNGNIGVAVASYIAGTQSEIFCEYTGDTHPIYTYESGLLIFFFDEDGEIMKITFVPLKDLPGRLDSTMSWLMAQTLNDVIEHCGGDLTLLQDLCYALQGWCELMSDRVAEAEKIWKDLKMTKEVTEWLLRFAGKSIPGGFILSLVFKPVDALHAAQLRFWESWFHALNWTQFYCSHPELIPTLDGR